MREVETPVLIVGAGPVGMLAAALLADQGIDSMLIEEREGLHQAPQAHVISSRTQEILAEIGIDEAMLAKVSTPWQASRYVTWRRNVASPDLARIEVGGHDAMSALDAVSARRTANVPQHLLERLLLAQVSRRVCCQARFGQSWRGAEQSAEGVTSRVRDATTGETYRVRSQWLLAADGASSSVRRELAIPMLGETGLAHLITVNFEADIRHLVGDSPSILYWTLSACAPGTFIVHDAARYSVFMTPYFPPYESPQDFPLERCERLLRTALGDRRMPVRITSLSNWTMQSQVAERYHQGRTFLIGDAAHRFPPTGGLGLNTGAADAHNLAWKLALVMKGQAGPGLLETYAGERRPSAEANARLSTANFRRMRQVTDALGLNQDHLPVIARLRASAMSRVLPARTRSAVKKLMVAQADARLRKVARAATPTFAKVKQKAQQAAEAQREHFHTLGMDLGYVYRSAAICEDGNPAPQGANPVMDCVQCLTPGARFPHFHLRGGAASPATSHALIGHGHFLLAGFGCHGPAVADLARTAGQAADAVVRSADLNALVPEAVRPLLAGWAQGSADCMVMIRPDGHIAWRHMGAAPVAADDVTAALNRVLQIPAGKAAPSHAWSA